MRVVLHVLALTLLVGASVGTDEFEPEFLVPQYHRLELKCPGQGGSKQEVVKTFKYCGSTISGDLVLHVDDGAQEPLCEGVIMRGTTTAGWEHLQAIPTGGKSELTVLCIRGYGVLRAKDAHENAKNKQELDDLTQTAKNLQPTDSSKTRNEALFEAIYGAHDPVTRSPEERGYLNKLKDILKQTTVQGVKLDDYFQELEKGGHRVCVVGGAVRDSVVGSKIKDVDVAVTKKYEDFQKALETVWMRKNDGSALEIEDVLRLEGTRKRFGMALLDPLAEPEEGAKPEDEGLDIGQLKVKRPLPKYYRVPQYEEWQAESKKKLTVTVATGDGSGAASTAAPAQIEFTLVGEFRDVRHPEKQMKILNTKAASSPKVHEHWEYPLNACLQFTRNLMSEVIVTHLALEYVRDYHLYRCFKSHHPRFERYSPPPGAQTAGAAAAAAASTETVRPEDHRLVFEIHDWGLGVKNGLWPPPELDVINIDPNNKDGTSSKKSKKARSEWPGTSDDDILSPDSAVNQYLYGFSFKQDAKLRDYRANAVYAVFQRGTQTSAAATSAAATSAAAASAAAASAAAASTSMELYFVDPLTTNSKDSGMSDLTHTVPCQQGTGPGQYPLCDSKSPPKESDRTKCCFRREEPEEPKKQKSTKQAKNLRPQVSKTTSTKKPGLIRAAPYVEIADKPAYEQDLGGQFRFFKMLKKGFEARKGEKELVKLTCHYMLLRLDEATSAPDDKHKYTKHYFKRFWKKLFDEKEKLADVRKRLIPIYKTMQTYISQCRMTWDALVRAAGQVLYPDQEPLHKLLTSIVDNVQGDLGYMQTPPPTPVPTSSVTGNQKRKLQHNKMPRTQAVMLATAASFSPPRVHYDDEKDVPDSHIRHLAAHVITLHLAKKTGIDNFEEWLDRKVQEK